MADWVLNTVGSSRSQRSTNGWSFLMSQGKGAVAPRHPEGQTSHFWHQSFSNRPRANYKRKKCNLRSRDLGYINNVPRIYLASSNERKINKYTGSLFIEIDVNFDQKPVTGCVRVHFDFFL